MHIMPLVLVSANMFYMFLPTSAVNALKPSCPAAVYCFESGFIVHAVGELNN